MNANSESGKTKDAGIRWIGAGFIAAFSASILTVILTGLNVEGSSRALDAGFQSVTMTVGETRSIKLSFESSQSVSDAMLEVTLPEILLATNNDEVSRRGLELTPGDNTIQVEIQALAAGNGFIIGSVRDNGRIDGDRVFVTVVDP